jgi:1,2-phenylacetyl-CoA epoxidase PaaB subunit
LNENQGNIYHPKVRKNSKRSTFLKDDKEQVSTQEMSESLNFTEFCQGEVK